MKEETLIKFRPLQNMILASVLSLGCQSREHQPIPSARVAKQSYETKTVEKIPKIEDRTELDLIWVNGSAIPMEKVNKRLEILVKFRSSQNLPLSKHQQLEQKKRIEDLFIGEALLRQHAKKEKILISDRVVIDTLGDLIDKNFGSRDAFIAHLKFQSMTRDEYLEQLKTNIISKKLFHKVKVDRQEILDRFFQDFHEDGLVLKTKVTLFQSATKRVYPPMNYRNFRRLFVNIEATHDLGWVSSKESGIPEAVFLAKANDVVSVLNDDGTFFYWIMKKRKVLNPRFLMVKHRLRLSLLREKREEARRELIEELRKKAIIRYGIPPQGLTKPEDTRKKMLESVKTSAQ